MSMSTGDVRRPSLSKLTAKAAATDKPDPDVIDADESDTESADAIADGVDELDESDADAPVSPTRATVSGGGKVGGGKVTAGRVAPVKAGATKATAAKATGAKPSTGTAATKATPSKTTVASKTATAATKAVPARTTNAASASRTQSAAARNAATKSAGARPGGGRPGGRGPVGAAGGKGRKPGAPIKVKVGVNWGPIAMFTAAGVVALAIISFGAYQVIKEATKGPWQQRADAIPGIHDYLKTNPAWFVIPAEGNHKAGVLTYPTSPPVGGIHNPTWQDCMGDVYTAEVPKEQATHSMEHGAVWVTYNPTLPKDQVETLAAKVRNKPFMLMSPYPNLDAPISLQAWGYQLKLNSANDSRIDDFISALRQNTTQEPQAGCSSGITDTGTTPLDMSPLPTAGS